jgi:hypothetical protein
VRYQTLFGRKLYKEKATELLGISSENTNLRRIIDAAS